MLGAPPQALSMSTNSMRDVGAALLVTLCDHGYEVMKILISSLFHCGEQIRDKLVRLGYTPAGDGIPAGGCLKTIYGNLTACETVTTTGDVAEIFLKVLRSSNFIDSWVDKAERVTGHLVGNRYDASPERSTGTGTPDLCPASMNVVYHGCIGIGNGGNIG